MPLLKMPPYEIILQCRRMQRKQFVEINYNGLKFRIIETPKGWISELAKKNFWGKTKWVPLICYRGSNEPYPYETDEKACSAVLEDLKDNVMRSFYMHR